MVAAPRGRAHRPPSTPRRGPSPPRPPAMSALVAPRSSSPAEAGEGGGGGGEAATRATPQRGAAVPATPFTRSPGRAPPEAVVVGGNAVGSAHWRRQLATSEGGEGERKGLKGARGAGHGERNGALARQPTCVFIHIARPSGESCTCGGVGRACGPGARATVHVFPPSSLLFAQPPLARPTRSRARPRPPPRPPSGPPSGPTVKLQPPLSPPSPPSYTRRC